MTATTPSAPPVVVGDGTTTRDRAGRRWRRLRPLLVVVGVLLAGGLLAALPAPRTSTTPLAPDNVGDNGARALAQILQGQGVEVTYVRTARDAARAASDGGTLLVAGDFYLTPQGADLLAQTPADLVLVAAVTFLDRMAPGVGTDFGANAAPVERTAACADEDARAAQTVTVSGALVALSPATEICFPADDGSGGYAVTQDAGRRVVVLADPNPLTNASLTQYGNAALTIRMLGRHDHLVWYVPSAGEAGIDPGADAGPSLWDLAPPWLRVLAWQLLVVALVVALWRGRRLGPVLAERLPVVVPAAETTRGRGRLYRRGRSYGHAGAALRAGTATRLAARLGLPRSADAPALVDAAARASGRAAPDVERLLYGPPPHDERALAALADELDTLESEVHRS